LVLLVDLFIEIVDAEQGIDLVEDFRRSAEFLREGADTQVLPVAGQQGRTGEVGILVGLRVDLPPGGDRGQLERTDLVVDLAREPVVLDLVGRIEVVVDDVVEALGDGVDLPVDRSTQTLDGRIL
jgi:hypothetical protein